MSLDPTIVAYRVLFWGRLSRSYAGHGEYPTTNTARDEDTEERKRTEESGTAGAMRGGSEVNERL
jgi:hypothetical protein